MTSEFYFNLSNAIFVLEQEEVSLSLKEDLGRLGLGLVNQSRVIRGMPTARLWRYRNARRKQDREDELRDDEEMNLK